VETSNGNIHIHPTQDYEEEQDSRDDDSTEVSSARLRLLEARKIRPLATKTQRVIGFILESAFSRGRAMKKLAWTLCLP